MACHFLHLCSDSGFLWWSHTQILTLLYFWELTGYQDQGLQPYKISSIIAEHTSHFNNMFKTNYGVCGCGKIWTSKPIPHISNHYTNNLELIEQDPLEGSPTHSRSLFNTAISLLTFGKKCYHYKCVSCAKLPASLCMRAEWSCTKCGEVTQWQKEFSFDP